MEITIENLKTISNEEELKAMAPLEDIIKAIEKEINPLSIHVTSYAELYNVIKGLKNIGIHFKMIVIFKTKALGIFLHLLTWRGKKEIG